MADVYVMPSLSEPFGIAPLEAMALDVPVIVSRRSGVSEVLLLTPPGWSCPEDARPFTSEEALLAGLAGRVRELDPDVLTGWNVVDFDLSVLARLAERIDARLGRFRFDQE